MSGIFGIVSNKDCTEDLFLGTFYLQHRAQDYCGLALSGEDEMRPYTHKGLIRQQFTREYRRNIAGHSGIGAVASNRQPVSDFGRVGGLILAADCNIINHKKIRDDLIDSGASFSGYLAPEQVSDAVLIAKIISNESSFEQGIEALIKKMKGDFAIVALTKEGVFAARGWGRKPLILGRKDGCYAVSSESVSFENSGMEIVEDVKPGEVVLIKRSGIYSVAQFDLSPVKYGTFEWIYNSYPPSIIDNRTVAEVRRKIGNLLAKRYPVEADLVSPVPNSGRWHAIGYAQESGLSYIEVFTRYDYSDRSYTPSEQIARDEEARTKLLPVRNMIENKRIVLVDDSIVRGTQTLNQVSRLRDMSVKEIHIRVACPPLMAACPYGKTTREDEDCIARRMSVERIQELLKIDSLGYATFDDLEEAIGYPKDKLCLECWIEK